MVKMIEEQKAQRIAARRRAEAEAEEARELRREAKRRECESTSSPRAD